MNSPKHYNIAGVDVSKAKLDFTTSGKHPVQQVEFDDQGMPSAISVARAHHQSTDYEALYSGPNVEISKHCS